MFISWKGDLRGRVKKTKSYPTQAMTLYNRQPFNGIVFDAERLAEVFTLHDPMPTTGAPMRFKLSSDQLHGALLRIGWCPLVWNEGLKGRSGNRTQQQAFRSLP
jgi:hypothetical protein